jgi:hypothetical protein
MKRTAKILKNLDTPKNLVNSTKEKLSNLEKEIAYLEMREATGTENKQTLVSLINKVYNTNIENSGSYNKLIEMGIEPDQYPADAVIGGLLGTYSKDRETVCILIGDNFTESEQENFDNLVIKREQLKEIALTVNTLITNFGIEIHSHSLKTDPIYKKFKISKS